jgi:hypothetical protein
MVVASHQPAYLPWLGYFDKILRCDTFVLSDNCQYTERDYINRNFVKGVSGDQIRLTVPVQKRSHLQRIDQTLIADRPWATSHLETIRSCYRRAPCFDELFPALKRLYAHQHETIDELCYDQLLFWLTWFGITRSIVRTSDMQPTGKSSQRILNICVHLGATSYFAGAMGRNYLRAQDFADAGIRLVFQDFHHPVYPQQHGPFLSHLGVVDFAMNGGTPEQILDLRSVDR